MSRTEPVGSGQGTQRNRRISIPGNGGGQYNGRAVQQFSIATLYAKMKYPDVVCLNEEQQHEINRIVSANDTINTMLNEDEENNEVLKYFEPVNRQAGLAGTIINKRFESNRENIGSSRECIKISLIRAELDYIDLEEEPDDAPSAPLPAVNFDKRSDENFKKVSLILGEPVNAGNFCGRMLNSSELNACKSKYSNGSVEYVGVKRMKKAGYGSLGEFLNDLKNNKDDKMRIATLHDTSSNHFVTILVRGKNACIFDSLPKVESSDAGASKNSGEKAMDMLNEMNAQLVFFDKIDLVENRLQQHNDDGEGKWFVQSCGLFSLWLHEYASKYDYNNKPLPEFVDEFALSITKKNKIEKDEMDTKKRLEVLHTTANSEQLNTVLLDQTKA